MATLNPLFPKVKSQNLTLFLLLHTGTKSFVSLPAGNIVTRKDYCDKMSGNDRIVNFKILL